MFAPETSKSKLLSRDDAASTSIDTPMGNEQFAPSTADNSSNKFVIPQLSTEESMFGSGDEYSYTKSFPQASSAAVSVPSVSIDTSAMLKDAKAEIERLKAQIDRSDKDWEDEYREIEVKLEAAEAERIEVEDDLEAATTLAIRAQASLQMTEEERDKLRATNKELEAQVLETSSELVQEYQRDKAQFLDYVKHKTDIAEFIKYKQFLDKCLRERFTITSCLEDPALFKEYARNKEEVRNYLADKSGFENYLGQRDYYNQCVEHIDRINEFFEHQEQFENYPSKEKFQEYLNNKSGFDKYLDGQEYFDQCVEHHTEINKFFEHQEQFENYPSKGEFQEYLNNKSSFEVFLNTREFLVDRRLEFDHYVANHPGYNVFLAAQNEAKDTAAQLMINAQTTLNNKDREIEQLKASMENSAKGCSDTVAALRKQLEDAQIQTANKVQALEAAATRITELEQTNSDLVAENNLLPDARLEISRLENENKSLGDQLAEAKVAKTAASTGVESSAQAFNTLHREKAAEKLAKEKAEEAARKHQEDLALAKKKIQDLEHTESKVAHLEKTIEILKTTAENHSRGYQKLKDNSERQRSELVKLRDTNYARKVAAAESKVSIEKPDSGASPTSNSSTKPTNSSLSSKISSEPSPPPMVCTQCHLSPVGPSSALEAISTPTETDLTETTSLLREELQIAKESLSAKEKSIADLEAELRSSTGTVSLHEQKIALINGDLDKARESIASLGKDVEKHRVYTKLVDDALKVSIDLTDSQASFHFESPHQYITWSAQAIVLYRKQQPGYEEKHERLRKESLRRILALQDDVASRDKRIDELISNAQAVSDRTFQEAVKLERETALKDAQILQLTADLEDANTQNELHVKAKESDEEQIECLYQELSDLSYTSSLNKTRLEEAKDIFESKMAAKSKAHSTELNALSIKYANLEGRLDAAEAKFETEMAEKSKAHSTELEAHRVYFQAHIDAAIATSINQIEVKEKAHSTELATVLAELATGRAELAAGRAERTALLARMDKMQEEITVSKAPVEVKEKKPRIRKRNMRNKPNQAELPNEDEFPVEAALSEEVPLSSEARLPNDAELELPTEAALSKEVPLLNEAHLPKKAQLNMFNLKLVFFLVLCFYLSVYTFANWDSLFFKEIVTFVVVNTYYLPRMLWYFYTAEPHVAGVYWSQYMKAGGSDLCWLLHR